MKIENIAAYGATALLLFHALIVAPQAGAWGPTTTALLSAGAFIAVVVVTGVALRLMPREAGRALEYDAAWDDALADLELNGAV